MERENYGALIERGRIDKIEGDGYIIRSTTRAGIQTPPLTAANDETYEVGDAVCFFMFDDGRGKIIARM